MTLFLSHLILPMTSIKAINVNIILIYNALQRNPFHIKYRVSGKSTQQLHIRYSAVMRNFGIDTQNTNLVILLERYNTYQYCIKSSSLASERNSN